MMKRILISGFACAMLLIGIVDAQSEVARIYFKDSNHDYGVDKGGRWRCILRVSVFPTQEVHR